MDELSEFLIELVLEGLLAALEAVLTSRKEKSDLQEWMKQKRQEQMIIGEQMTDCA